MTMAQTVAAPSRFRLEEYFPGMTRAKGIFQDRFGTLRRQFDVAIEGRWDGQTLTLVEDFTYDDGEVEQRVWRIRPVGEHGYRGHADGVVGIATGAVAGTNFKWRYRFALPIGKTRVTVLFDDAMYLQSDGTIINTAKVTKFGILLGEVTLVFHKVEPALAQAAA